MQKNVKTFTDEDVHEIERELRYISRMVRQKGREILANFPITPPQFEALHLLKEFGDMTIGELSTKMFLAFSTITDLIDRMEANELVERVRDVKDRRVVRIHLKEKGIEIIKEVLSARRNYLASIIENFSEEEVKDLARMLELLHNEMKKERSQNNSV